MKEVLCHECKCVLTDENCGSSRFKEKGLAAYCRVCDKKRLKKYNEENKERLREYKREASLDWYYKLKNDPERWAAHVTKQRQLYRKLSPEQRSELYQKKKEYLRKDHWSRNRKHHYGITGKQFLENLASQDNKCEICQTEISFEAPSRKFRPHQDHCHSTGENRGILCNLCNVLLGNAHDSIEILLSAVRYLEKYAVSSSIQTESVINSGA
jgi:hypothetical protein